MGAVGQFSGERSAPWVVEKGERLLKQLATHAMPMSRAEIAVFLSISRRAVAEVVNALLASGRLMTYPSLVSVGGRKPQLYCLPGQKMPEDLRALLRQLTPDTVIVTPSGARARVVTTHADGFVEFVYLVGPMAGEEGEAHAVLLLPVQAGRELPAPVRVDWDAE
jgi:hypothetical protein